MIVARGEFACPVFVTKREGKCILVKLLEIAEVVHKVKNTKPIAVVKYIVRLSLSLMLASAT
jgi:hypothetical protein